MCALQAAHTPRFGFVDARPKGASGETEAFIVIETQQEFIMMKMKHVVLAMAATGMLSGQALAVEGWDAEAPGVQPVQAALAGTEAALPEQVALVVQEPAAQVVEYSAKLPAVLPELPAALAVAEPAPFSAADMQALFVPSTEPLRVAVLSAQEMEETQGAVIPLVVAANFAWNVFRVSGFAIRSYRVIGPAFSGGRILQVSRNNNPIFRIDNHNNPHATRLHFHVAPNMRAHRSWHSPWRAR